MTVDERFERSLPSRLTDLYLGPTPDYRDDLLLADRAHVAAARLELPREVASHG